MASSLPKPVLVSPENALALLEKHARAAGHELASRGDVGEDVLHYLAQNGAAATRRAVAENPSASPDSNALLAEDIEDEVRVALASKIGRLLPGLLLVEKAHVKALTIATLERLARDTVPRVRAMLAEEIKRLDCVPKDVIQLLAQDAQTIVASPILECSPLLTDYDLLEIIASAQARDILAAVARRKGLSDKVAQALVRTLDVPAIAALLANCDADIRKKTLDRIVVKAAETTEWHEPLVMRADLSMRLIRRIASFVGASLIERLAQRHKLDAATRDHLNHQLETRLKRDMAPAQLDTPRNEVEAALGVGEIDDDFVGEAAETGQRDSVVFALSGLVHVHPEIVRKVLSSGSAKALTALVWKAKLSMRTAVKIQTFIMRLRGADVMRARDGTDFPMNAAEMRWHLGYYSIPD
jgi:uncharacterized protein (DUF2336 family)